MSSVTAFGAPTQDEVARAAGARAARVMGQVNALAFELVDLMVEVLDAEAWGGGGSLRSPVHWLCWRTGLSESRAKGLVAIAKRVHELPECVERFRTGRLTEDAMVLIARKAPASRDRELAELAPMLLHSQLKRVLAHLPEQERRTTPRPGPTLGARFGFQADGTWRGTFVLPADQGAIAQRSLESTLCPHHHRAHHQGLFEITGNPEQPHGLRFNDRWGRAIGPPRYGPPAPPPAGDAPPSFTPPTGERLDARWFTWN